MGFARFLVIVALSYAVFFAQASRVLEVMGVQPNLILVGFLVLANASRNSKEDRIFLVLVVAAFSGLVFWLFNFWFWETLVAVVLASIFIYTRSFLTGNLATDFFLLVSFTTLFFYVILRLTGLGEVSIPVVAGEIFYSFVLGMPIWYYFASRRSLASHSTLRVRDPMGGEATGRARK